MRNSLARALAVGVALSGMLGGSLAVGDDREDGDRFFEAEVRPLLVARCQKCHGPRQHRGGLRLDSRAAVLKGGETGPAIVPGKPGESLLVEAIRYESLEMPPTGRLSERDAETLTRWVEMGAPWPDRKDDLRTASAGKITTEDRAYWAFRPPGTPAVPADAGAGWARNPVDRFIAHKLNLQGIEPAPEADRRALIRRASFDLVGLPPEPGDVDAFLADASPTAYEAMIDRLLASPQYGERWGRHWLDLVRYAESDGHGADRYRPEAWRYRDYVIRAFNEDKPYDRFVLEQLAGDEVAPDDFDALTATGFLRHWIYENNQRQIREVREIILNDVTDVTGEVFLGLGFGCARCHDHKFDPILQEDYYRLQAFFAPMLPCDDIVGGEEERARFRQRQAGWEARTVDLRRELDALEDPVRDWLRKREVMLMPQDLKDIYRKPRETTTPLERQLVALIDRLRAGAATGLDGQFKLKPVEAKKRDALHKELARYDDLKPGPLPAPMAVKDVGPEAPQTVVPGSDEALEPGFPVVLGGQTPRIERPAHAPQSTGRRAALARWITSADNPLTARVMVNRIWQHHFGTGLVATPSDFGRLGDRPSHPELLDWLAARFVRDGWSIKSLHRLIMNSATYRQSALAAATATAERDDPNARWLWRMNVRRLDAEQIRDAILAASGELDARLLGPSVEATVPRRSVYLRRARYTPEPLLQAFDAPDGFTSIAQRDVTTTATQALTLMNGAWTLARAEALAARLLEDGCDDEALVAAAYRRVLSRSPDAVEAEAALRFLREQPERVAVSDARSGRQQAVIDFCHVLLNSSELVYAD